MTNTTFIHEFGHYIRDIIPMVYFIHNKNQALEDLNFISKHIMNSNYVFTKDIKPKDMTDKSDRPFSKDEEEKFARVLEKYLRNGEAPNEKFKKLFNDFEMDTYRSIDNQRKEYEWERFGNLKINITPAIKKFLDELAVGSGYKIMT